MGYDDVSLAVRCRVLLCVVDNGPILSKDIASKVCLSNNSVKSALTSLLKKRKIVRGDKILQAYLYEYDENEESLPDLTPGKVKGRSHPVNSRGKEKVSAPNVAQIRSNASSKATSRKVNLLTRLSYNMSHDDRLIILSIIDDYKAIIRT